VAWYETLEDEKARYEAAIIVSAFAGRNIDIGGVAAPGGGIDYMYDKDTILVREQYLGGTGGAHGTQNTENVRPRRGVLDVLRDHGVGNFEVRQVVRGIVVIDVNPDRRPEPGPGGTSGSNEDTPEGNGRNSEESNDGSAGGDGGTAEGSGEPAEGDERDALFLLERIEEEFGARIATLNHVVTAAGNPSGCPATEPQEVYEQEPYPPACPGEGGHGVRIYVADTGIVQDTVTRRPWLDRVTGDADPSVQANGTILPYGGHGTFVAGVIRCLAPGADIVVRNVFDTAGSALEADFVPKLYEGFAFGADIFHVTVASLTKDKLPLMAFEAWMADLHQHKGVVCLVPAGNSESRLPHWPAAFPGLISVGALGPDWHSRAYFSNYGGWVDVYAPGQNLVNAFATGTFTCQIPPFDGETRKFSGLAQWSGTSFSTPIVTGLIAARMTRCGESAQEAAAALLAEARAQAIPAVGPVLLPACDDDEPCHHCGGESGHSWHCGCSCGHGGTTGRCWHGDGRDGGDRGHSRKHGHWPR
jgi:subtilisin family serine protease